MKRNLLLALTLTILVTPTLAQAYIGPGAGVSAIGAALALVAGLFFAIVGFVWYPIKRLLRKRKAAGKTEPTLKQD